MSILENYQRLCKEIEKTALSVGRDFSELQIVAVSKTFSLDTIQKAVDSGIKLFGENKVQEAKGKIEKLTGDYSFHLVGHLQSNKAKDAVKHFDLIHSIDKFSTASKVDIESEKINKSQKILIQVNTSGEGTKSGVEPDFALDLCKEIVRLKNITLLGLMTIGPFTDNKDSTRKSFRMLKELLVNINKTLGLNMRELSMGMSSDYNIAVEEGATILRIGSAIFGQRVYTW